MDALNWRKIDRRVSGKAQGDFFAPRTIMQETKGADFLLTKVAQQISTLRSKPGMVVLWV
jgi:hypothetical protein